MKLSRSGIFPRLLAAALLGWRLVALFPVLFAAQPLAPSGGIIICHAGGEQNLPVSEPHQIALLGVACSLAAAGEMLLPAGGAVPLPRFAVRRWNPREAPSDRGNLALAAYQARAPPPRAG